MGQLAWRVVTFSPTPSPQGEERGCVLTQDSVNCS